ncbi:hypothetical protein LU11_gp149 [Pseudomonas phage Lu11]|uniref:hypothetical protein n=1 Tax=Pseudomonas phage Lu11 TaxID=1161927 RepID=UPI00025F17BA|nr:hypothetical protein LU11_gp149 [Pseudomonas phage Lu11]AFH14680.1 hypothetical protein Lu11_0147 [Pseudomonas phage Lu11]
MSDEKIFSLSSDVDFNIIVYCLMRAVHLPELEGQELPLVDTWFAVPAVKHGPMVALAYGDIEMAALQMIDADGKVVKAHRVNPHTVPPLTNYEMDLVRKEAFDIPLWEKTTNTPFPYATMFDKDLSKRRFVESGSTKSTMLNIESTNETYNIIRKKIQPRPCTTCGGGKRK